MEKTLFQHVREIEKVNLEQQPINVEQYFKVTKVKEILEAGLSQYPLNDFYSCCGHMDDNSLLDYIVNHVEHLQSLCHDFHVMADNRRAREDNAFDTWIGGTAETCN